MAETSTVVTPENIGEQNEDVSMSTAGEQAIPDKVEPPGLGRRGLTMLDRFGEKEPVAKTCFGGLCSLVMAMSLLLYGLFLFLSYDRQPPKAESAVHWSVAGGPFPLPLTCYYEICYVSLKYDKEVHSQGAACVAQLEEVGTCHVMRAGESRTFDLCFSQLPGQGIRAHFGGAPSWSEQWRNSGMSSGTKELYGMTTVSDMEGTQEEHGVMKIGTPVREGTTLLTYVHSLNKTWDENDAARERHEWFSTLLSSSAGYPADFASDPCVLQPPSTQVALASMKHVVLTLAPSFTRILVERPPFVFVAIVGEMGGAGEVIFTFFMLLLMVGYKLHGWYTNNDSAGMDVMV